MTETVCILLACLRGAQTALIVLVYIKLTTALKLCKVNKFKLKAYQNHNNVHVV